MKSLFDRFGLFGSERVKPRPEDKEEADSIPRNRVLSSVKKCPRCGEPHRNLVYNEFVDGPAKAHDIVVATHWTVCPIWKEPIFAVFN